MQSIFKNWSKGSVFLTDAGWGDSGKGKVVSALVPDVGVKIIGGHNAGHTVVTDKGSLGLGLIPSSIIHPKTLNIIGSEVVINPIFLINEIENIKKFGIKISSKNLKIDSRTHLVLRWHEIRDALNEEWRGKSAIGSLFLGVGWAFSDRINRRGLRLMDLFDTNWKKLVRDEYKKQLAVIAGLQGEVEAMTKTKSKVDTKITLPEIYKTCTMARENLQQFLGNTKEVVWNAIDKNKKILFEDSHGAMLDVAHGSWPYTTGVNTGLGALYRSFGGKAVKSIIKTVVCTKAYQTRVGGGPMPTEDFGKFADYVREKGHEVGTRSGRARRCGAIDLPILKYGYNVLGLTNNDEVAITKLDVLSGLNKIPVCISYKHQGKTYVESPSADAQFLEKVNPKMMFLSGWSQEISKFTDFKQLPKNAQNYINFIQKKVNAKITFIGVGQHKDAKIII